MAELVSILQSWIDSANIKLIVTDIHVYIMLASLFAIFAAVLFVVFRTSESDEVEKASLPKTEVGEAQEVNAEILVEPTQLKVQPKAEEKKTSWKDRLSLGLSKSRNDVWGRLGALFSGGKLSEEILEEIEEILYTADIGPKVTASLIEALETQMKKGDLKESDFKTFIKEFLKSELESIQSAGSEKNSELFNFKNNGELKVIMIVGVNGAGKTTTIGKLATKLTASGAKVVVGACDTFRAAAVDQLQVWCERANATMIRAKEGANPSGVGYDALQTAMNEKADYCILDTAGRLHTAENLMDELTKSKNVLKKLMPEAPHHILLVIDAITGQNAIRQAEEFNKALGLTGLIFTKCDGSSKAGSAVSIVKNLQVPITYIGVGENVDDLNEFVLKDYLDALVGN